MCPSITPLPRTGTPIRPGGGSAIAVPPAPGTETKRPCTADLATTPMTRSAVASAASTPASSGGTPGSAGNGSADRHAIGHANGHTPMNGHVHDNGKAGQQQGGRQLEPRAGSKRSRQQQPVELVAGREVVGRRLSVWWQRPQEWVEGRVKEFDAAKGMHRVAYDGQQAGMKEGWLALGASRFQWLSEPRHGQGPNPTFSTLPSKEALVGARVKIFWPGMGRWYLGTVKGYDGRTKKHKVAYKDGDLKLVNLRHEAVVLTDDSPVTAVSPSNGKPAALSTPGSTPGGASTPGSGGKSAASTPGSSSRKAPLPKQPAKAEAKQPIMVDTSSDSSSDSGDDSDSDSDSDSGSDSDDGRGSGSASGRPAAAKVRTPNADRRRDLQRRAGVRSCSGGAHKVTHGTNGSSRPRPDTKAGRALRRASSAARAAATAAVGSKAAAPVNGAVSVPANGKPVAAVPNGKRPRDADSGKPCGSPPKLARLEEQPRQPQQQPQQPVLLQPAAAEGKAAAVPGVSTPDQQPQQQPRSQQQQNGSSAAPAAAVPQQTGKASAAVPQTPGGPAAAASRAAAVPAHPAHGSQPPQGQQPQQPPSSQQTQQPPDGMPTNGHAVPQQQQQPPGCVPAPVGFSPKATTLQAALSMPLTGSPATPLTYESLSFEAYKACRPEDDPLHMAASLLRGQGWQPAAAAAGAGAAAPAQPQQPQRQPAQQQPQAPQQSPQPAPQAQPQLQQPPKQPQQVQQQQQAQQPPSQPKALSPIRVRLPIPAKLEPLAVGTSPALPPPEPLGEARRSKLPEAAGQQPGSAGGRPLRAARLAAAVAGGASRGEGALAGARIAVYWREDAAYYKGTLAALDGYHKRAKVVYDDGEEEWLSLPKHAFRWLAPRARSAGCGEPLKRALYTLGAQGIVEEQLSPPADAATQQLPDGSAPPAGQAAVGQRVAVWCPGDGKFYRGELLHYDRHRGQHHILYEDGEDEALRLGGETVRWLGSAAAAPCTAGLPAGKPVPRGQAAVGWRIGVWWREDRTFYVGDVTSYSAATGRHSVLYDDGEREAVLLASEKLKWLLPPDVGPSEDAAATAARHSQRRRPRRRTLVESSDDDDEDYVPYASSRPSQRQHRPSQQQHAGEPGRTATGGFITRLPQARGEFQQQQAPPPDGELVAERWLPSMAPLGLAPNRPGSFASQMQSLGAGSTSSLFSRLSHSSSGSGFNASGSGRIRVAIYASRRAQLPPQSAGTPQPMAVAAAASGLGAGPVAAAATSEAAAEAAAAASPAEQQVPVVAAQQAAAAEGAKQRQSEARPVADSMCAPTAAGGAPADWPVAAQPKVDTATAAEAAAAGPSAASIDASPAAEAPSKAAAPESVPAAAPPPPPSPSADKAPAVVALERNVDLLNVALGRMREGERRMAQRNRVSFSTRRLLGGKLPVPEAARASGTPTGGRGPPSSALFGGPPVAAPTPYTPAAASSLAAAHGATPSGITPAGVPMPPAAARGVAAASAPPLLGLPALRAPASAAVPPAAPPQPAAAAPQPTLLPPRTPAPTHAPAAAATAAQRAVAQAILAAPVAAAVTAAAVAAGAAAAPQQQQVQAAPSAAPAALPPSGPPSPMAPGTLQELLRGPVVAGSPPGPTPAAADRPPGVPAAAAAAAAASAEAPAAGVPTANSAAAAGGSLSAALGTGRSVPDTAALAGGVSSSDEDAGLLAVGAAQQALAQGKPLAKLQAVPTPQPLPTPPVQQQQLQRQNGDVRSGGIVGSKSSGKSGSPPSDCRTAASDAGRPHGDGPQQQAAH